MRENDGRKLDHKTLALRLRAVAQIEGGAHPEDVTETLPGVLDYRSLAHRRLGRASVRVRADPRLITEQDHAALGLGGGDHYAGG